MVTLEDVGTAAERIRDMIRITPVKASASLSRLAGGPVWLKCEHRQETGAFKLRGASNAAARLGHVAGVTTASTGNHGRALAHAARQLGLPAVICVSRLVPRNKLQAIEALGAEARVIGASQDEAFEEARRLRRDEGFALIPPFDHPDVIAGQGTLGLEILDQIPDAATIAVPLSGGGLLAGVALAVKGLRPDIRIIGISMERGAAMAASLKAGHPVEVEELETLADSLGGGVGLKNRLTFSMCRDLMDQVILLTEAEIAAGVRHLALEDGETVEGAAAVGAGAIIAGKLRAEDGPLVLILSGQNIDPGRHAAIVRGEA
ncbi:hydroxyectoine utilization dehydratase EutB [Paracoccus sp. R12_1]|uniref:hydroxyectoine utilization dehydratase EutB n=1 Tax=unclassified Paracoccus (in: a-proteobacteria) TaxID=2688777 RepID=UPI001ADD2780|nr:MULTISPECIES: hydroxyectoine utilization dehydratase EutB [unclassified Paracoccus (in: a-proteobacteria)]MBO9455663.1 hydroxyectoine utilization dehydratase EutB [Paracoccus sp. R12_2]MBO9486333.1 hydroxyectoine utilization dehydratase EutB [Paracoccus sp. R12_1]